MKPFSPCAWFVLAIASSLSAADVITPALELPAAMPWNLAELSKPPRFEWVDEKAPVRSLMYVGEPYMGKPTKVFAYYATPQTLGIPHEISPAGGTRFPGVVLIHGGGGTAFKEWAELWARRGYAAIAMDLAGHRPNETGNPHDRSNRTRLEGGGPNQNNPEKFDAIRTDDVTDDWPYHAVANAVLAHSLLRSFPEVDAAKTAVTGISWGGYATCLVASVDNRFKAAVPVYGCGFLHENSAWLKQFEHLGPEMTRKWVSMYDPSSYLAACRVPIFFINGTNDNSYPLDSYMKSYELVEHAEKNIRIEVNMKHSHPEGWKPKEIGFFIDQYLRQMNHLPRIEEVSRNDQDPDHTIIHARVRGSRTRPERRQLHMTKDEGPINRRTWSSHDAHLNGSGSLDETSFSFVMDPGIAWFVTYTDSRGAMVSSKIIIEPR